MGVDSLVFAGVTQIDGIPVLGKGCVGLVTQAIMDNHPIALKIRRMDADRPSMEREAKLLRLANSVDVGPRLVTATRNFIAMELFTGIPLYRWSEIRPSEKPVRGLLTSLLDSCFRLDSIGLDHGELSHAPKNVLVGPWGRGCIVDFESASTARRVSNVTSLIQYFMFGRISKTLRTVKMFQERRRIIDALSEYKEEGSVQSYLRALDALGL